MSDSGDTGAPRPAGGEPSDMAVGEVAAAELVLGLLDGDARRRAIERALRDPAFAAELEAWNDRLSPLWDEVAPAPVSAAAWAAIARQLEPPRPAADVPLVTAVLPRRTARRRSPWRFAPVGIGLAAAATMAGAVVLLPRWSAQPPQTAPTPAPAQPTAPVTPVSPPPAAPLMVAELRAPDAPGGVVAFRAEGSLRTRTLQVTVAAPAAAEAPDAAHGRVAWMIPPEGGAPLPLGFLRADGPTTLFDLPNPPRDLRQGVVIAISLEPTAPAPPAAPTGPVVAQGPLAAA